MLASCSRRINYFTVRILVVIALGIATGCDGRAAELHARKTSATSAGARGDASGGEPPLLPSAAAPVRLPAPAASCSERVADLRARAAAALPELDAAARARLLAEVKATPVVFIREPRFDGSDPVMAGFRRQLERSETPGRVLAKLRGRFRQHPALLRSVLLTEGYVYATTPALGTALSEGITPSDLFREPEIVIESGAERVLARRADDGRYVVAEGPDAGKPARTLLWDRVWAAGAEPREPLHADARGLIDRLGADGLELERVTDAGIVASLRFGTERVLAVLSATGGKLEPVCLTPPTHAAVVAEVQGRAKRQERVLARLREVIHEQVAEDLPFDEPKTEFGQEDGRLRQEWRLAYRDGRTRYEYNGDRYAVFDRLGRPRVPQVCIDFVFDTFERLGGSWYGHESAPRTRRAGRVDFDTLEMENRRNVEEFLALAQRRPDLFEVRPVPPEERVPLARRDRFFATLFERRAEYRPGDVVVILGLRDDDKYHYHSFFVMDADPVTGMPTLVGANSGRPRVRAWAVEMAPAPKRSLFARVRPRLEWLETFAHP
jgi:hypothetical protein